MLEGVKEVGDDEVVLELGMGEGGRMREEGRVG